jgi:hypothetical protein
LPVLEISDGDGGLHELAREMVLARMIYPRNALKHFHQLSWLMVDKAIKANAITVQVPTDLLRYLKTAPSFSATLEESAREMRCGDAAGELLEFIIACHFHHPRFSPSVSKAWDVLSKYRKSAKARGADLSHSVAFLKAQWKKFKPVVHLWTAQLLMMQADRSYYGQIWKSDQDVGLLALLGFAETLRKQAEAIVPHGRREAVLDPAEMWTVPADLKILKVDEIQPAPLDAEKLALLRARRAPKRI